MSLRRECKAAQQTFLRTKKYCLVTQKRPLSCQLATSDLDGAQTFACRVCR